MRRKQGIALEFIVEDTAASAEIAV